MLKILSERKLENAEERDIRFIRVRVLECAISCVHSFKTVLMLPGVHVFPAEKHIREVHATKNA